MSSGQLLHQSGPHEKQTSPTYRRYTFWIQDNAVQFLVAPRHGQTSWFPTRQISTRTVEVQRWFGHRLAFANLCWPHCTTKACFPFGEFIRANSEKSNVIGWQQTLTPPSPNHIRVLLIRAKKSRSGKRLRDLSSGRAAGLPNRPDKFLFDNVQLLPKNLNTYDKIQYNYATFHHNFIESPISNEITISLLNDRFKDVRHGINANVLLLIKRAGREYYPQYEWRGASIFVNEIHIS